MTTMPSDVGYGRVTGDLSVVFIDGTDANDLPDVEALTGTIVLTPTVPYVLHTGQSKFFALEPYIGQIVNGKFDFKVVGCDNIQLNPTDFAYTVGINLNNTRTTILDFTVEVGVDDVVDLVDFLPVAVVDGVLTMRGRRGEKGITGDRGMTGLQGTPGVGQVNLPVLERNFFPDPRLKSGTANWQAESGITVSVAPPGDDYYPGIRPVRVANQQGSAGSGIRRADLVVGERYTIRAMVKRTAGSSGFGLYIDASVRELNGAAQDGRDFVRPELAAEGRWMMLKQIIVASQPNTGFYFYNGGARDVAAGNAGQLAVGAVSIVKGGVEVPWSFRDGDEAGHHWTSTPYASSSAKGLYSAGDLLSSDEMPVLARNLATDPLPLAVTKVGGSAEVAAWAVIDGGEPFVQFTGNGNSGPSVRPRAAISRLEKGKTYTISAELWTDKASGASVLPEWPMDGYAQGVPGITQLPGSTWTKVVSTRTITVGDAGSEDGNTAMQWVISGVNATGTIVRVRKVVVVEGTVPGEYLDGNMPGCAWVGAPGLSQSVRLMPSERKTLETAPELARNLGRFDLAAISGYLAPDKGTSFAGKFWRAMTDGSAVRMTLPFEELEDNVAYVSSVLVGNRTGSPVTATIDIADQAVASVTIPSGETRRLVSRPQIAKFPNFTDLSSAGGELLFDDWMVHRAGISPEYFDGNTPGCRWLGKPYASTSVKMLPNRAEVAAIPRSSAATMALVHNAMRTTTGGGLLKCGPSNVISWSHRFIAISTWRGFESPGGHFSIERPSVGTVIKGVGGATDTTVTSEGVPMDAWGVLWYILPIGSNEGSKNDNFRRSLFVSDFSPPDNWLPIAWFNGENEQTSDGYVIYWINGAITRRSTHTATSLRDVIHGEGPPGLHALKGAEYVDRLFTNGARKWRKMSDNDSNDWKVIEGDTGWCRMDGLAAPGFSLNGLGIRRVNDVVEMGLLEATANEVISEGAWSTFLNVPVGFGSGPYGSANPMFERAPYRIASTGGRQYQVISRGGNRPAGYKFDGGFTYTTRDPWPTSIPGTPG